MRRCIFGFEKKENSVTWGKFTQYKKRKCLETSIATYVCSLQNRNRKYEKDRKKQIDISERQNCCKHKPQWFILCLFTSAGAPKVAARCSL